MHIKYDVVILGAGINGIAIAKALALEEKKVLVIEKNHIASGASSHSSRLIHGGLRYLEHFEFSLVREALNDQQYLLETYPDLVKLRHFYLPIYKNSKRPVWMIRLGLWLYSFFAKHEHKAVEVKKKDFLDKFKSIKEKNLKAVFKYFDGKTDDYALTQQIAQEAKVQGVEILEETELKTVLIDDEIIKIETSDGYVETNLIINATGAWIDEINAKFNLPSSYSIEKLSGIHLVIDRVLTPEPLILETASKRIFFIIPEINTTIIGTTERSEDSNVDDIKIDDEDVEYLLRESNRYLKSELNRDDIKEVYIGTRPIIKSHKDPTMMSREYKLDLHHIGKNRVMHVYGGKLTTFPSLARRAVEILIK
ncbi:FAD dependent oxidoreductase [Sulfurimonas gotlandica GD1]|uniref:FAD dependent oxidoreductase n=1 Tax=Sulfurimonas gotlandica (strain DSM 19862 / JCM 16533 / GD1) TaxID=929558 RepID=B6BLQ6_SULGG|nr:glycerol-3-phosphate dehydrogenase/oxidase [Sulfurimonas gotlandica]EDZ62186.1 aerobic glycerol-3-phosphate dehydrogenase [Sulfurimonas gotlandica GD1]EHP28716.1 FAD dependent oxidoreductase [Sulfurimonas gotlandica GD1]